MGIRIVVLATGGAAASQGAAVRTPPHVARPPVSSRRLPRIENRASVDFPPESPALVRRPVRTLVPRPSARPPSVHCPSSRGAGRSTAGPSVLSSRCARRPPPCTYPWPAHGLRRIATTGAARLTQTLSASSSPPRPSPSVWWRCACVSRPSVRPSACAPARSPKLIMPSSKTPPCSRVPLRVRTWPGEGRGGGVAVAGVGSLQRHVRAPPVTERG